MKRHEKKKTAQFDRMGLGDFLRRLADAAEGRSVLSEDRFFEDLPKFEELKLKIKRKAGRFYLKAKVASSVQNKAPQLRPSKATASTAALSDSHYKDLKKRLQASFRQIGERLNQGQMPAVDTVGCFLSDSELMTGVPGKGEEYYGTYKRACAQFASAFEHADLSALKSAYAELKNIRIQAHRKYKYGAVNRNVR